MEDNVTETKANFAQIKRIFLGGIFIGIGLLFLLDNLFYALSIGRLWPLFLLVPVAILMAIWLQDKNKYAAVLFPVTTLIFFMGYFLWLNFTSWFQVETTWPNFLIGPGLGFLALFLAKKEWGFLIPAITLLILAGIFYSDILDTTLVFSLGLIATGIFLIIKPVLFSKKINTNSG